MVLDGIQLLVVAQVCFVQDQHIGVFNLFDHQFRPRVTGPLALPSHVFKVFKEFRRRDDRGTSIDGGHVTEHCLFLVGGFVVMFVLAGVKETCYLRGFGNARGFNDHVVVFVLLGQFDDLVGQVIGQCTTLIEHKAKAVVGVNVLESGIVVTSSPVHTLTFTCTHIDKEILALTTQPFCMAMTLSDCKMADLSMRSLSTLSSAISLTMMAHLKGSPSFCLVSRMSVVIISRIEQKEQFEVSGGVEVTNGYTCQRCCRMTE